MLVLFDPHRPTTQICLDNWDTLYFLYLQLLAQKQCSPQREEAKDNVSKLFLKIEFNKVFYKGARPR